VKRTRYEAPHYAVFSSSHRFHPLRSKYSPQHPVVIHLQSMFFSVTEQASCPYKTTEKTVVLYILIFKFLGRRREDKKLFKKW